MSQIKNFKQLYKEDIIPQLVKSFNYKNSLEVPKISKVVINMGVGEAVANSKVLDNALRELELIAGQKAVATKAKKSISTFKLRENMPIGCKVTLRGDKMYAFLERLVYVAFPRVRDFRGFSSKSLDGQGNFNIGVKEQIIFPEVDYDKVDVVKGMDIAIVTTAKSNEEAKTLLSLFNFPFNN